MTAANRPFQRFLMVGVQRTGSSALAEFVNTHPAVATGWEWSEHTPYLEKLKILERGLAGEFSGLLPHDREHIEASIGEHTRQLGFRRLFGASNKWMVSPAFSLKLLADRFSAHMRWLDSNRDVRVVHIVRTNHTDWIKSKFVAAHMENYVGSSYPEDLRIQVPVNNAVARVQAKIWVDDALGRLANSHEYIRLDYERLGQQMAAVGREVIEFLGEDPDSLDSGQTSIRRQSTRKTSDYIANFSELRQALARFDDL